MLLLLNSELAEGHERGLLLRRLIFPNGLKRLPKTVRTRADTAH